MGSKNKKPQNLLELPNPERLKLIKELKEKLQQRIIEEKLWQSLLETENIVINGNTVYRMGEQLCGFSVNK
ncbi:MAG: hypothetical protein QXN36_02265 [Candidatus Bathyarchaeia archaeon]